MHDLEPKEASAEKKATSSFAQCVIDGAKKNKDGAWGTGRGGFGILQISMNLRGNFLMDQPIFSKFPRKFLNFSRGKVPAKLVPEELREASPAAPYLRDEVGGQKSVDLERVQQFPVILTYLDWV